MSDEQIDPPAPAPAGHHPGLVTTRQSFALLDGTYTSVEISLPFTEDAGALAAAVEARLAQAELQIFAIRERLHPFGAEISPAHFVVPWGKYRGKTLAQVMEIDPDSVRWYAEGAEAASAIMKYAARLVFYGLDPREASYQDAPDERETRVSRRDEFAGGGTPEASPPIRRMPR